jgi:hypothetical protein
MLCRVPERMGIRLSSHPYSPKCLEKPSEKSRRCSWCSPKGCREAPFEPFRAPYTGQTNVGALFLPLFGQFQKEISRKFGEQEKGRGF